VDQQSHDPVLLFCVGGGGNFFVSMRVVCKVRDSPYYSESELCGGAVTVSFSKYLPWQSDALLATLDTLL